VATALARAATALARAAVAFHAVKLAGLVTNLAMFPVLRPDAAGSGPVPRPDTSLLIPARDESRRLPAALAGFGAQDVAEIVVLDDQSSDDTATIVCRAAEADPRVRSPASAPSRWANGCSYR